MTFNFSDITQSSGSGNGTALSTLQAVIAASGPGSTFSLSGYTNAGTNVDASGNSADGSSYAGAGTCVFNYIL